MPSFSKKIYFLLLFFLFSFFSSLLITSPVKSADDLFNIQSDSDAIAIRVIPNPENYDIGQWYRLQGFTGSPQQIEVDGYRAIRDGRTIYVSASNINLETNEMYFNVYLISYNQEADDNTIDIFGKIIKNLKFNTNLVESNEVTPEIKPGFCSISNMICKNDSDCPVNYVCGFNTYGKNRCIIKDSVTDEYGPLKKLPCRNDSDCPTSLFCDSFKACVIRDMDRLRKYDFIIGALERYKQANGNYPVLRSGTYVPHIAISSWPSWRTTFLAQINTSNILDPINTIGSCFDTNSEFNLKTCWEPNKKIFLSADEPVTSTNFALPKYSNVFSYVSDPEGQSFKLYSSMETFDYHHRNLTFPSGKKMSDINPPYLYRSPYLVEAEMNGESGKPFNAYIKAEDPRGESLSWELSDCVEGQALFREGEIFEDYTCPADDWSTWNPASHPEGVVEGDLNLKDILSFNGSSKAGNSLSINSSISQWKVKEYVIGVFIKNESGFSTTMNVPIYIKNKNPVIINNNIYEHNLSTYSDFSFNLNISDENNLTDLKLCYLGSGDNPSTDCLNTWNFDLNNYSSLEFTGNELFNNKIKADISFDQDTYRVAIKNKNSPYKAVFNTNHINDHHFMILADDGYDAKTYKTFKIKFTASEPEIFFDCSNKTVLGNNYVCNISSTKPNETITTTNIEVETPSGASNFLTSDLANNLVEGTPINDNHLGTFKIRATIKNEFNLSAQGEHSFTVFTAPKLITYDTEEENIQPRSFLCKGLVVSSGHNSNYGYHGCLASENESDLTITSAQDCQSKSFCAGETGISDNLPIEINVSNLSRNKKIYYRVFAINEAGIGYGEIKNIHTKAEEPVLNISEPSIVDFKINLQSNITDDGGGIISSRGFFWSKSNNLDMPPENCSLENFCWSEDSNSAGEFSTVIDMEEFDGGENYYFKAFAINKDSANREKTGFSNIVSYLIPIMPSISDIVVSDITNNSAKISAKLSNPHNLTINKCGVIYSLDQTIDSGDSKIELSNCPEQLNFNLNGLNENTTYYFKTYITGGFGSIYTPNHLNDFKTKKLLHIRYDGNGNTSGTAPANIEVYSGDNFTVSSNNDLVKLGHTFSFWNNSPNGLGDNFIVGESYQAINDLNLYAQWTANPYTIKFESHGGSNHNSINVLYGQSMAGVLPTPSRAGYTFSGWYINSEYTGDPFNPPTYLLTMSITLHAKWIANQYDVVLDWQNGIGTTENIRVTFNKVMPSSVGIPEKTGHIFLGYFDALSEGTQYYTSGMASAKNWDKTSNATLYAHWTPIKYTITFNGNGGSGHSPQTKQAEYNQTISLPSEPTKAGHEFKGWWTSAGTTGGTQFTALTQVTESITVYARWEAKKYTINFNVPEGVIVSPTSKEVTYGQAVGVLPSPNRPGYEFNGWWTSSSGGIQYTPATIYTQITNLVLHSRWTAKKYTITFNKQGGTGGTSEVMATFNQDMPPLSPANAPTKEGYNFIGYFDASSGGTQYYTSGMTSAKKWDKPNDATLYARWTVNQHLITFNYNGASGYNNISISANHGETISLPATPSRIGYEFMGWFNTEEPVGGDEFTALTPVIGSYTVYARWEANQYILTFDSHGDTSHANKTVTYGQAVGALPTPSKAGHTFIGWYTSSSGGIKYTSETVYQNAMSITLHARWTVNQQIIKFDGNGAPGYSPVNISVDYGSTISSLPVAPNREAYNFVGWFRSEAEGGDEFTTSTVVTSSYTVYARWTIKTYTVIFDGNKADNLDTVSFTVNHGTNIDSFPEPSREGYNLVGWFDTADDEGGNEFTNKDLVTSSFIVYARWAVNYHTITFNAIGYSPIYKTAPHGGSVTSFPADPSRTGYNFNGWWTSSSGGIQFKSTTLVYSSYPVYAQWLIKKYIVSFNSNGGTVNPTQIEVNHGSTIPSSNIPTPTRNGYAFTAWWTHATGGNQFDFSAPITNSQTVYARWEANQYTLAFDSHGGTNHANKTVTYGQAVGALPTPSKAGHTFIGWYTSSSGGIKYTSETVYQNAMSITLHAHWTASQYTVTFDKQNGTGGTSSVTATYNANMPSATAPSRAGYTFAGYFDAPNGGGTQYYSNTMTSLRTWDKDSDTTLYAKWNINTYTITFNPDGGEVDPAQIEVNHGSTIPSSNIPTPTKDWHTFTAWWTHATGGNQFDFSAPITNSQTVYARWERNTCDINFDGNGGSGHSPTSLSPYCGTTLHTLPPVSPTRTGYTFAGWWTEPNGGEAFTTSTQITSSCTIYAHWTASQYTVTFDKQNGTGGTSSVTATYNANMPSATAPSRAGYTFAGYFDAPNGGGTQYYSNTMTSLRTWDKDSDTTLYAKWNINTYTITFSGNGGSGHNPTSSTATYGNPVSVFPSEPSRIGYTFNNWWTALSGGTQFTDSTPVYNSRTIYARWTPIIYTITFNSNGANKNVTVDRYATYNQVIDPFEPDPSRIGHDFIGWWTEQNTGGTQFYSTTKVTDSYTVYARWRAKKYTVTLNKSGGTGGVNSVLATYGLNMPSATAPSRLGYIFLGYFDASSGGKQYYSNTMTSLRTWDKSSDTTLYAQWQDTEHIPGGEGGMLGD